VSSSHHSSESPASRRSSPKISREPPKATRESRDARRRSRESRDARRRSRESRDDRRRSRESRDGRRRSREDRRESPKAMKNTKSSPTISPPSSSTRSSPRSSLTRSKKSAAKKTAVDFWNFNTEAYPPWEPGFEKAHDLEVPRGTLFTYEQSHTRATRTPLRKWQVKRWGHSGESAEPGVFEYVVAGYDSSEHQYLCYEARDPNNAVVEFTEDDIRNSLGYPMEPDVRFRNYPTLLLDTVPEEKKRRGLFGLFRKK